MTNRQSITLLRIKHKDTDLLYFKSGSESVWPKIVEIALRYGVPVLHCITAIGHSL